MEEIDFIQPKKTIGKLISIDVFDKIKAEIKAREMTEFTTEQVFYNMALDAALHIIDKYKKESEK